MEKRHGVGLLLTFVLFWFFSLDRFIISNDKYIVSKFVVYEYMYQSLRYMRPFVFLSSPSSWDRYLKVYF